MNCPKCAASNPSDARFCGNCAAPFQTPDANQKPCPNCNEQNRANASFCASCGTRFQSTAPVTSKACPSCGETNEAGVRFCGGCGASLSAPSAPASQSDAPSADVSSTATSLERAGAEATPAESRTQARTVSPDALDDASGAAAPQTATPSAPHPSPLARWKTVFSGWSTTPVIAALAAVAIIVVGTGAFFLLKKKSADADAGVSATDTQNDTVAGVGQTQTLYATRLTRMRDAPTSQGSNIIGNLNRGDSVSGVWVIGSDGQTRWLKVSRPGQNDAYAWGMNLLPNPRPAISTYVGADQSVPAGAVVYTEPSVTSPRIDNLSPGATVSVTGVIDSVWSEIALRSGGVGYVSTAALHDIVRIDGQVAWPNGWDNYNAVTAQCQGTQYPNYIPCIIQAMRPFAPNPKAYDFAQRLAAMELPGWASNYIAYGRVDLVIAEYPFRANTNSGYLLVNGSPEIVNVEGFAFSERDKQMTEYRKFFGRYPEAFLTNHQGFVGHQNIAGGQRFLFVDMLSTCRACEPLATAEFAYTFDTQGRLLGTKLVRILPPGAARELSNNVLPPR